MSTDRQVALQCATQIVLAGEDWKDSAHRAARALEIAAHFHAFLATSDGPPDEPAAPTQAIAA